MSAFLEFLENHPRVAATFVVLFVVAALVEYGVRRRRGSWRPVRERPWRGGPGLRYVCVTVMLLAAALGVWQLIGGLRHDRPGLIIMGGFIAAFGLWVTWMGLVRGRDAA